MAKTIAVSDDVYKKLKKAKMSGESFSSAIKRTLETRPKLSEIAGSRILTPKEWNESQRALAKAERKSMEEQ
jgi:predicted CopG family antitoxin